MKFTENLNLINLIKALGELNGAELPPRPQNTKEVFPPPEKEKARSAPRPPEPQTNIMANVLERHEKISNRVKRDCPHKPF